MLVRLCLALLVAAPALAQSGATIATDQATVTAATWAETSAGWRPVAPTTRVNLITGPYNGWWWGKTQDGRTEGWFDEADLRRDTRSIPDGPRWIDITVDDASREYKARLLVGTTVVDEMKIGTGTVDTPTPEGSYKTTYKKERLFELQAHPGVYLKNWQTFRWDGPGTYAWGLHSWVLDSAGWPVGMGQFGRVSHGCIRLPRPADAFAFLPLGGAIHIHFSPWVGPTGERMAVRLVDEARDINVRAGIGTDKPIIGKVQGGQRFVSDGQSQGWCRIRYDNREGWVWGNFVRRTSATTLRVTTSTLNVRAGAGTGHAIVGKASYGMRYVVAARQGDWAMIFWRGGTAWVNARYAETIELP